MSKRIFLISSLFFGLMVSLCAFGQEYHSVSSKEIVDYYMKSLLPLKTMSAKINDNCWRDLEVRPKRSWHYEIEYRRDNDRTEWIGKVSTFDEEGILMPESSFPIVHTMNSKEYITLHTIDPAANRYVAIINSKFKKDQERLLGDTSFGMSMNGNINGNNKNNIADLLSNSNDLHLLSEKEVINGLACYVLKGATRYGEVTAWISPDKGYNALKWTISKTEGDYFNDEALSKGQNWSAVFEADGVQKVGDVFVISDGRLATIDQTGNTYKVYHKYKRTEIDLNPDYEALGAFQINLPEGTIVINRDIPGISFIWSNGELVPYIDKPVMKQIDEEVGELLKEKVNPKYKPYAIMEESNGVGSKRKSESLTPPIGMTVSELLAKYQASQNRLRSFIARGESTLEIAGKSSEMSLIKKTVSEFRYDGSRVNHRVRSWNDEISPCKDRYESFLWDGKSFIKYQQNSDPDKSRASVSRYDSDKNKKIAKEYNGAALMGICCGDYERIDLILSKARFISLQGKTDMMAGSECYVIEANTKRGKYKVWIDPKHGYNIARIEVQRNKRDLIHYMESLKTKMSFSLKNVRFEKIDDVWVPMEADIQQTEDNGNKITRWHHKRIEFVLNPDHNTLESFVPDDIQDGTMVKLTGDSKKYEWQKGRPVALAEPRRLRRILPSQKDDTCVWRAHE